jgi:hypothetical protein
MVTLEHRHIVEIRRADAPTDAAETVHPPATFALARGSESALLVAERCAAFFHGPIGDLVFCWRPYRNPVNLNGQQAKAKWALSLLIVLDLANSAVRFLGT